jgi:GTP-binding protein
VGFLYLAAMSQIRFIQSASHYSQFPASDQPQVAIAGRSNSGKSSFINSMGRQKVAKVSSTPGKTRLLNIFDVDGRFWLVDMPGYGYAARSHSERREWEKMVEDYLANATQLKGLILLMDIRRNWTDDEAMLIDYCVAAQLHLVIGLTKADKLSRSRWLERVRKLEKELGVPCFAISSLKKWGASELLAHVGNHWLKKSTVTST